MISDRLCQKLIDHVARCQAPSTIPAATPDFNALAVAFGSLSSALAWGGVAMAGLAIVIAVIVAVTGFAWGRAIVREAKADAREEANRIINAWLLDEGVRVIREAASALSLSQETSHIGPADDPADDIGREA